MAPYRNVALRRNRRRPRSGWLPEVATSVAVIVSWDRGTGPQVSAARIFARSLGLELVEYWTRLRTRVRPHDRPAPTLRPRSTVGGNFSPAEGRSWLGSEMFVGWAVPMHLMPDRHTAHRRGKRLRLGPRVLRPNATISLELGFPQSAMPSFPAWFYVPCSAALIVGALCSVTILFEVLRRRQHMAIMSSVWPVCTVFDTVSEAKPGDTAVSPLPSVRRPGPFTAAVLADSAM